jgi:hypothetical protein
MSGDDELARVSPKFHPSAPHVTRSDDVSLSSVDERWKLLTTSPQAREALLDDVSR